MQDVSPYHNYKSLYRRRKRVRDPPNDESFIHSDVHTSQNANRGVARAGIEQVERYLGSCQEQQLCGASMARPNRQSRRRDSSSTSGNSANSDSSGYHRKKRRRASLSADGDSRSPQRRGERDGSSSVSRYRMGGMIDTDSRPSTSSLPKVGEVLRGRVAKIQTFGAFVMLMGYNRQGEDGQKRRVWFGVIN